MLRIFSLLTGLLNASALKQTSCPACSEHGSVCCCSESNQACLQRKLHVPDNGRVAVRHGCLKFSEVMACNSFAHKRQTG